MLAMGIATLNPSYKMRNPNNMRQVRP